MILTWSYERKQMIAVVLKWKALIHFTVLQGTISSTNGLPAHIDPNNASTTRPFKCLPTKIRHQPYKLSPWIKHTIVKKKNGASPWFQSWRGYRQSFRARSRNEINNRNNRADGRTESLDQKCEHQAPVPQVRRDFKKEKPAGAIDIEVWRIRCIQRQDLEKIVTFSPAVM